MVNLQLKSTAILIILILTACSPTDNSDLPTLVRLPTDAPVATALVAQSVQILPASFTPTFTTTVTLSPTATIDTRVTATVTPSATITDTPTPTATEPPTLRPQDRPIIAAALTAAASTVLPANYQIPNFAGPNVTLIPQSTATFSPGAVPPVQGFPTSAVPASTTCTTSTSSGFLTLYQGNPDIANQLGCPSGDVQLIPAAWQSFETGIMTWLNGEIVVFYTVSDTYQGLPDTFVQGSDPETSTETPPAGLFTPIRGFLKVWDGNSAVRNALGWASNLEAGTTATVQTFSNGRMIYVPGRPDILVLIGSQSGIWLAFQGAY